MLVNVFTCHIATALPAPFIATCGVYSALTPDWMRPGVVHVAVAASYALVAMYDGAWFHTATALPCESMPTSGDQAEVDASSCTGLPQPSVTENGRAFTCVVPGALVEYTIMALPP